MDGCPLGLGLVVEDKPTEFSCTVNLTFSSQKYFCSQWQLYIYIHVQNENTCALLILHVMW